MKKFIALSVAALALAGLTACNNNKDKDEEFYVQVGFDGGNLTFTPEGYWNQTYNTQVTTVELGGLLAFSHNATVQEWGGVTYEAWKGFTVSRAAYGKCPDLNDLVANQWSAAMTDPTMAAAGYNGSMDYLLGFWDVQEPTDIMPTEPVCCIGFPGVVRPQSIAVNNSNYAYWAMRNGTSFSKAFGKDDWFKLEIIGVVNDVATKKITHYLAKDGNIQNAWETVDLSSLGQVNAIYFQLSSSDNGQWGMNTPAYFCVDDVVYIIKS